jgi:hypothetical protein
MFAKACSIAREFTFPVVISHKNAVGECSSGIGTFVVINDEGWFVTAYHIIDQIQKLSVSNKDYKKLLERREQIKNDTTLLQHTKKKQLNNLKIEPTFIDDFSVWFGWDGVSMGVTYGIPQVDLAVGQLVNFDKTKIKRYPEFKDHLKSMEQGSSLCKLGFPFHSIKPTYEAGKGFILPPGSIPIPIIPIEGIYTRTVAVQTAEPQPFPYMFVETSSPGLSGQSGGPTFDIHGAIWAIQSQTQHFKLGFDAKDQNGKEAEHLKNQYLNVGWGIHSQTITSFLKEKGIDFQTSAF